MSRKSLKVLFHMGAKDYKAEYERRFNDEDTIHLPVIIGENPVFICQTPEIYKKIISILQIERNVEKICSDLPKIAIKQFQNRSLIDEILLTNNIEGVHSTRKEIGEILQDLSVSDKRNRFVGLVSKYVKLSEQKELKIETCKDIRQIYDDIFYEEIKTSDTENLPDGEIFRKSGVNVYSATQKVIHNGLFPESKIIEIMQQSLNILNDESIDIFIRIAVFHYLFGYIHPFYDGNGRTSRFISSYLLSKELNQLIGFRLSYTIKENISKYYKAFEICNDSHNKGELTPFVEMFVEIIEISMNQLAETLEEKRQKLYFHKKRILKLPNADKSDICNLYYVLIQAALFSDIGISRDELISYMRLSPNTVRTKLKQIHESLLITNLQKGKKFYLLNLNEAEKYFDE